MGSKTILTERILGVCPSGLRPVCDSQSQEFGSVMLFACRFFLQPLDLLQMIRPVFRHHLHKDYGRSDRVTIMGA